MDKSLRVVPRLFAKTVPVGSEREAWRRVAEEAYEYTGLDWCASPVVLADRLGLDCVEGDCTAVELIGRVIYYPSGQPFQAHCLDILRATARAVLVFANLAIGDAAQAAVTADLALPKYVAMTIDASELEKVNPFLPPEYLREVYMRHRRSGEFEAPKTG